MRQAAVVFLITAAVYGFGLGRASLWDIDEAIYAEISRTMVETGDWTVPVFNGEPRFDKPPLLYWISAAAISVIGPKEVAVRIGSYLFALLGVGLVYAFGRRFYSQRAGLFAAVVLGSNLGWFVAGRIGLMDTGLSFFVGLALYAMASLASIARESERAADPQTTEAAAQAPVSKATAWFYALISVAMALGVLTKGPVALVLFGGATLLYLGPGRLVRLLARPGALLGLGVFLLVALPWHLAVYARSGAAWWESYFGYHMFSRFTQPLEEHGFGWFFYIIVIAAGFLPWTGYALAGAWRLMRRRARGLGDGTRLMLVWFGVVVVFFSASRTKLPGYLLPAFLPLAVLTGAWCDRTLARPRAARTFSFGLWGSAAVGVLATAGLVALRPLVPEGYEAAHRVLFLFPAVLVVGVILTLGIHLLRRDARTLLYGFAATAFAAMILFTAAVMPLIESEKPVKPLIAAAMPHMTHETLLVSAFGDASSAFYADRPVSFVHGAEEVQRILDTKHPVVALVPKPMVRSLTNVRILTEYGPGALVVSAPGPSDLDEAPRPGEWR